ncbi:uncharacterized protein LOC109848305 isoform X4 [Asparagus officinalis]|uniref:uncharacterized protein LOC109848305 isoform X4 n=1 Tax=Asparagus officinalis TaxID=4686 RepID=UPI00098DEAAF|nr:uncharacterized protein LOC109848305 isoform X4 [Asparagus officinalis]
MVAIFLVRYCDKSCVEGLEHYHFYRVFIFVFPSATLKDFTSCSEESDSVAYYFSFHAVLSIQAEKRNVIQMHELCIGSCSYFNLYSAISLPSIIPNFW